MTPRPSGSRQPPGPRGVPLFGSSRDYAKDPFEFITAVAEAYGDVARFDLGPMETYMLTNPADIERVLVTDDEKFVKPTFTGDALGDLLGEGLLLAEGERWERQRDLARPAFNMSRIAGLADTMVEHAEATVADWADGEVRNVETEMARLTVRIIVDAMFGTRIDEATVQTVQENLEPLGQRFEPDPFRVVVPDWAPTRENREYQAAIAALESVVDDLVERRQGTQYGDESGDGAESTGPPDDLLSILLRARDRGEQTDEQIRDELVTMLLAGHDTTALALTYTWYLLAEHPDVEARVHAELDDVLGDGRPTAADARRLDYLDRVLTESMRLYPPVYAMFREPKVDVRLAGYRVPAGAAVMLPQWAVHRSDRWYDDPLAFDPDRWRPERSEGRPRFAYFPFGGGPRHCIGRQFSLLEAKLILATVARRFRLRRVGDGPVRLRGSLTMHPRDGMRMELAAR